MRRYTCGLFVAVMSLGAAGCDAFRPLPPAIFVAPASLTLEDGQSSKLTARLRNPKSRTVTWSSSNTAVATVDAAGTVTAVTNGSATVTVRMSDDSSVKTTVPVTVIGPAVATIAIAPSKVTVYVTLALRLSAQLRAADGRVIRGRAVAWTSPDTGIADVSSLGVVRGRGPGGPIAVTATAEGRTATSLVRVAHIAELCPFIARIAIGQSAEGRLASGDCEFALDESFVDVYDIVLAAPATIQIDMTSTELDSYLGLFDAVGRFLGEDDNSGGGMNARMIRQLDAGTYRIWANTVATGAGAYALTVAERAGPATASAPLVSRFANGPMRR